MHAVFAPRSRRSHRRCRRARALAVDLVGVVVVVAAAVTAFGDHDVDAEPLRLRADAIAETQSPAGLVVLQGSDRLQPYVDAEALVWAGAGASAGSTTTGAMADVLVLTMRLREPHGYGELRGGRFVFATGAIRPVQIDGASAIARTPTGLTFEAMAGAPVVPRLGARAYDWVVAGRVAQSLPLRPGGREASRDASTFRATLGASYLQRRTYGEVSDDEVGADVAATPIRALDVAARAAYDLTSKGLADALVSVAGRTGAFRVEAFGTHRSPSRLLPATSLFSVLGDVPSDTVGTTVRWDAAPRLDVVTTAAAQRIGDDLGGNASLRALLRLDAQGARIFGLELRRQSVASARWTGVRVLSSLPIAERLRVAWELEVVVPDLPDGRGAVWPWGLVALSWRSSRDANAWEASSGVEGASTPTHRFELNALLRVSRAFEVR